MTSLALHLGRAAIAVMISASVLPMGLATAAPKTVVIYAPSAPPAPQTETQPPPPSAGASMVWQAGFWKWSGQKYEWVPGRYVATPNTALPNWVPGHWDQQPQGWVWTEGHWEG